MSEIFISYARPNETQARQAGDALREAGFGVWRDDELPAHRSYSEVIEERIRNAKAVLVLWTQDAARSQWVRAEADAAREAGTLVQASLDGSMPPMPFNQIQCADLKHWSGDTTGHGWQKVLMSIRSLAGNGLPGQTERAAAPAEARRDIKVCVVPFLNMSGDLEQEYFSDGISEDIIIDLSKISALSTVPRNLAFEQKNKRVDTGALARDLGVTHVLEGSVRKAGGRVRITAELIDCRDNAQLWGDRYDRDLDDIFAIQDEISKAIVAALQLKLLPREKKAIERRGTSSSEAYNLYLMARKHWISGNDGDSRRDEVVVRICRQVVATDPEYAKAWGLMALAQSELRFRHDKDVDPLPAAEKALELDPNLAEAYCIKARFLVDGEGQRAEAEEQIRTALRLEPESWEVNKEAAILYYLQGRFEEAVPYFEKAYSLVDGDYHSVGLLCTCFHAMGDHQRMRGAAKEALSRIEKAVTNDPNNGAALGLGTAALSILGEGDRAREWAQRAMLMDPENLTMRYNLACTFATHLGDTDAAMEMLLPCTDQFNAPFLTHFEVDPDIDPIREDPRFQQMIESMKIRIATAG